jgi:hypothetical protein
MGHKKVRLFGGRVYLMSVLRTNRFQRFLVVMKGSQLDVIQQHTTLAGNRLSFRHQTAIVILAPQPEDPFLPGFFALQQPDDTSYGDGREHYHFVFYPFHDISLKRSKFKTIYLSQKLYQTLKKSFPFSSIFSRLPAPAEEKLFSTQTPGCTGIYTLKRSWQF